jgi:methionine-S-sulfoxide reductase
MPENKSKILDVTTQILEKATFAGGCFWCMQAIFDKVKGVVSTNVGYTGGHKEHPTYEEVCSGKTGHTEAIEILYDPTQVSYEMLLDIFWKNIEPTMLNRQFVDFGTQYRTGIFYHNEEQKGFAEASKEKLERSGKFYKPIVTEIKPASTFYKAEEYHQQYYKKNPIRYEFYEAHSGRNQHLKTIWASNAKK